MGAARWPGPVVFAGALTALLAGACEREIVGAPPPLDRPHFPTGVTLHPDGRHLAVVSSNFDLGYSRGALFMVDLDLIDERLAGATRTLVFEDVYNQVAIIPPFGNEPIFAQGGDSLLLSARGENILLEVPLSIANGAVTFGCRFSEEVGAPLCGLPPSTLQVPGNDPFEVAVISENEEEIFGLVTTLSTPEVFYFRVNLTRDDDGRLTIDGERSFSLEGYAFEGIARGVRGLAVRPALGGAPATGFLTVERTATGRLGRAIDLVWFDANAGGRAGLRSFDLTAMTGSIEVRGLALSPSGDAIFVLLRNPDAIARVDLSSEGGVVLARLGGIASTCYDPIDIATAAFEGAQPIERLFVACFTNDSVLAYEPLTLLETSALRGMGRGPYSLAIDPGHEPPRLYVSFFLADTVGVVDLIDAEGRPALRPRAVLGTPREREGVQR